MWLVGPLVGYRWNCCCWCCCGGGYLVLILSKTPRHGHEILADPMMRDHTGAVVVRCSERSHSPTDSNRDKNKRKNKES